MTLQIQSKRGSVLLSGEMNIYTARETAEKLLPLLRNAKSPAVDLGQVAELDCSGLQILLAARRDAVAAGKDLRILAASAAVRDVLDLTQCDELRSQIRGAA
jgi:anti-sigma B factor antagonist